MSDWKSQLKQYVNDHSPWSTTIEQLATWWRVPLESVIMFLEGHVSVLLIDGELNNALIRRMVSDSFCSLLISEHTIIVADTVPQQLELPGKWHAVAQGQMAALNPVSGFEQLAAYLRKVLSRQPPNVLNPFRTRGVPNQAMFVGRAGDVSAILESQGNFVITGPRYIGKTCLAVHSHRRARARHEGQLVSTGHGFHGSAYLDVTPLEGLKPEELFRRILSTMGVEERDLRRGSVFRSRWDRAIEGVVERLPWFDLLGNYASQAFSSCVILLDECDGLVRADKADNYVRFRFLRYLTEMPNSNIRVVLFGYEVLWRAYKSNDFPFTPMRDGVLTIKPLAIDDVDRLLFEPIRQIGVKVNGGEELRRAAKHATGGLPSVVQSLGHAILSHPDVIAGRCVDPTILSAVLRSQAFVSRVTYLFDQVKDPLARGMAYLLASYLVPGVEGEQEILYSELQRKALAYFSSRISDNDVQLAVEHLAIFGVIETSPSILFEFSPRATIKFSNNQVRDYVRARLDASSLGELLAAATPA